MKRTPERATPFNQEGWANMRRIVIRILLGLILGMATFEGIGALTDHVSSMFDYLLMPGYLTAWLFYPGGVHDGHRSAIGWVIIGVSSCILFYAALWYLILWLLRIPRREPRHAS